MATAVHFYVLGKPIPAKGGILLSYLLMKMCGQSSVILTCDFYEQMKQLLQNPTGSNFKAAAAAQGRKLPFSETCEPTDVGGDALDWRVACHPEE